MTLVAPQWSCALFIHPRSGSIWYVMSLGKGQWDWEQAGEIDSRSDVFDAGQRVLSHLHYIGSVLANSAS